MSSRAITLVVNGRSLAVTLPGNTALLHVLRNDFSLNGPKYGCGLGECGACAILVDGRAVRSCVVPVEAVEDRAIVTLEGLAAGGLHPVQQAFVESQAAQCGYCLNGMIIAVTALLHRNSRPDEAEIREALGHQLCRCGTHMEILAAARRAVELSAEVRASAGEERR